MPLPYTGSQIPAEVGHRPQSSEQSTEEQTEQARVYSDTTRTEPAADPLITEQTRVHNDTTLTEPFAEPSTNASEGSRAIHPESQPGSRTRNFEILGVVAEHVVSGQTGQLARVPSSIASCTTLSPLQQPGQQPPQSVSRLENRKRPLSACFSSNYTTMNDTAPSRRRKIGDESCGVVGDVASGSFSQSHHSFAGVPTNAVDGSQVEVRENAAEEKSRRQGQLEEPNLARLHDEKLQLEVELAYRKAAMLAARTASSDFDGFAKILDDNLSCQICQDVVNKATTLNCSHLFCAHCIDNWSQTSKTCPICRKDITSRTPCCAVDNAVECVKKLISVKKQNYSEHLRELMSCAMQSNRREQPKEVKPSASAGVNSRLPSSSACNNDTFIRSTAVPVNLHARAPMITDGMTCRAATDVQSLPAAANDAARSCESQSNYRIGVAASDSSVSPETASPTAHLRQAPVVQTTHHHMHLDHSYLATSHTLQNGVPYYFYSVSADGCLEQVYLQVDIEEEEEGSDEQS